MLQTLPHYQTYTARVLSITQHPLQHVDHTMHLQNKVEADGCSGTDREVAHSRHGAESTQGEGEDLRSMAQRHTKVADAVGHRKAWHGTAQLEGGSSTMQSAGKCQVGGPGSMAMRSAAWTE